MLLIEWNDVCFEDKGMLIKFDRKNFFDSYKKQFGKIYSTQRIEGLEEILNFFEKDMEIKNIKEMAYMLATIKHETANNFKPIAKFGSKYYFNKYDPILASTEKRRKKAIRHGNIYKGDGYKYRGRGYVQITWKSNYERLGDTIGYDLTNNPDAALQSDIAYKIMSVGMRKGLFTGKKLLSYTNSYRTNYYAARSVINIIVQEQAALIRGYAYKFEHILQKSQIKTVLPMLEVA